MLSVVEQTWQARVLRERGGDFLPAEISRTIPALNAQREAVSGDAGLQLFLRFIGREESFAVAELDAGTGEAYGVMVSPHGTFMEHVSLPALARAVRRTGEGAPSPAWWRDQMFAPSPSWKVVAAHASRAAQRLHPNDWAVLREQYVELQLAAAGETDEDVQEATDRLDRYADRFGLYLDLSDLSTPFEAIASYDRPA